MKIAVLMSTYNGEKYLAQQIESILNQIGDFKLDLIVRDDGSKDNTQKILDSYMSERKLKWYTGANLGPAKSFIDLVKQNPGYDFYAFADQDDYWLDCKIKDGISYIERHSNANAPVVYCGNNVLVNEELDAYPIRSKNRKPAVDFSSISCCSRVQGCTMLFNEALAIYIQRKDPPNAIIMHDSYIAELCLAIGGSVIYDDKAYIKYRQHSTNVVGISHSPAALLKERYKTIVSKGKYGIAEQASQILRLYKDCIRPENTKWLLVVANYKKNLFTRIKLSLNRKIKFMSKNQEIALRLAIIFGNK